jgi:hypothetical protein
MMLATWLVEFYLGKCDELDDLVALSSALYDAENVKTERSLLEEDLRRFLESCKVGARFFDPPFSFVLMLTYLRMISNLTQYMN